jgi:hypothetical protein
VPLPSNARGVKAGSGFDFDTGGAVLDGAAAPSVGLVAGARRGGRDKALRESSNTIGGWQLGISAARSAAALLA